MSFTTPPLDNGTHDLTFTATDAAGDTSSPAGPLTRGPRDSSSGRAVGSHQADGPQIPCSNNEVEPLRRTQ